MRGQHFSEEQRDYLTSPDTLARWASKSIEERVRLFRLRYPGCKVNSYRIRKLYLPYTLLNYILLYPARSRTTQAQGTTYLGRATATAHGAGTAAHRWHSKTTTTRAAIQRRAPALCP